MFRLAETPSKPTVPSNEIEVVFDEVIVEQTARIVAQVEDVALELVVAHLSRDVGDRFLQSVGSLFGELRHADIARRRHRPPSTAPSARG